MREDTRRSRGEAGDEVRLRALLRAAPAILIALDRDGIVTLAEGHGLADAGLEPDAVVGRSVFELYGGDPAFAAPHRRALAGEDVMATAAVGERVFELRYTPLRTEQGVPDGAVGAWLDVTQRIQAERALRESEARNAAILAATPDLIFRISYDGIYLDVIANKDSDLYVPRESIVGQRMHELVPPRIAEQSLHFLARTRQTGTLQVFEYDLPMPDGARTYEARLVPSGPDDALCFIRDVSERKQAERERAALRAREEAAQASASAAAEADRLKSELLSTVSHELRTPLGAIKGFASGLLHYGDRLPADQRTESLRLIDEAADRLTELIDNLLDLQRVAAGQLSTVAAPVDLEMVVHAVVAELSTRSAAHHLEVMADPSLPPVWGDVRRLRQVTQNLVENAIKYSPGGGHVTVRLAEGAEMVEMRVGDEGVGIPPDQLNAIFERFHRVDNSSTRRIGGTGLGLAIVRELVRAQGGAIHAESAGEGKGSTFVVTFPAARA